MLILRSRLKWKLQSCSSLSGLYKRLWLSGGRYGGWLSLTKWIWSCDWACTWVCSAEVTLVHLHHCVDFGLKVFLWFPSLSKFDFGAAAWDNMLVFSGKSNQSSSDGHITFTFSELDCQWVWLWWHCWSHHFSLKHLVHGWTCISVIGVWIQVECI